MSNYKNLLGKPIVIVRFRKKGDIRRFGKLIEISGKYAILETTTRKEAWIKLPNCKQGYLQEVQK